MPMCRFLSHARWPAGELERLSLDDLRLRWRNHWGRLAPAPLSRGLLLRVMAYRLQAEAFGNLDRKTIRMLERLADDAADKSAANGSSKPGSDEHAESKVSSVRAAYEPLILKPGALLIREWQGRLERVTVLDGGFAWNGATYSSLSAVAFDITGTKWNGHRFFGVGAEIASGRATATMIRIGLIEVRGRVLWRVASRGPGLSRRRVRHRRR